MGGLCSSDPTPAPVNTTVVQGTQIPEWQSQGGQQIFEEAKSIAGQAYPTYQGPRIQGFSTDENAAFDLSRNNTGAYSPYLEKAGALTDMGTRAWDGNIAAQYMNPFDREVTQKALGDMQTAFERNAKFTNADAVQHGAYGGARHGIKEGLNLENFYDAMGDTSLRGNQAGYNSAAERFDADRRAALTGAGTNMDLGKGATALGQSDIAQMLQTGGMQRALGQASLDTAHGDYLEEREWPYKNLNFALGALTGAPTDVTSTSTTNGQQFFQQPSVAGQIGGLGLTAAALFKSGLFS